MKKSALLLCLCIVSNQIHADYFTDTFFAKKNSQKPAPPIEPQKIDYYQLLPTADAQKADLHFIKSRTSDSLDTQFLAMIESAFQTECFIQTQTYTGDSTEHIARNFPIVNAIEARSDFYQKAKKRFASHKNIRLHHGNPLEILPALLKPLTEKPIILLAPLYGASAQTNSASIPIIAELEKIQQSSHQNPIIIIDDIRLFYPCTTQTKNSLVRNYPSLEQIVQKIITINSEYQFAVIYDVLVAFHKNENVYVSPVVRAATISRLYDGKNFDINDVIKAELCIAHATGQEQEAIENLSLEWKEMWGKQLNLARHCPLWHGLTLLAMGNYQAAYPLLKDSKERGITDWRIDWYLAMAEVGCFFGIQ